MTKDKKQLEERFNWLTKPVKPPEKEPVDYPGIGKIIEGHGLEEKYDYD